MATISAREVLRIWLSGGGESTAGIFGWFEGAVRGWELDDLPATEIGDLRLMGEDHGGRWGVATHGTYRVRDATPLRPSGFHWDATWALITVRDPENGVRVILDGNKRALELWAQLSRGVVNADLCVSVVTGDLDLLVVRRAKAIAPLWR